MTKKKFVNSLLEAICGWAEVESSRFNGSIAGIFFGMNSDGTNETDHYVFIKMKDGSEFRVKPERVLTREPHEEIMFGQLLKDKDSGKLDDLNDDTTYNLDNEPEDPEDPKIE